jgi:hypothetical protein
MMSMLRCCRYGGADSNARRVCGSLWQILRAWVLLDTACNTCGLEPGCATLTPKPAQSPSKGVACRRNMTGPEERGSVALWLLFSRLKNASCHVTHSLTLQDAAAVKLILDIDICALLPTPL